MLCSKTFLRSGALSDTSELALVRDDDDSSSEGLYGVTICFGNWWYWRQIDLMLATRFIVRKKSICNYAILTLNISISLDMSFNSFYTLQSRHAWLNI